MVLKLTPELLGLYQPATLSPAQKYDRIVTEAQQQAAREPMGKKQSIFKLNYQKIAEEHQMRKQASQKVDMLSAQKYDQAVEEHLQQLRQCIAKHTGLPSQKIPSPATSPKAIAETVAILPQTDPNPTTVSKPDDYYYFFGDNLPYGTINVIKPDPSLVQKIDQISEQFADNAAINELLQYVERYYSKYPAVPVTDLNPSLTKQWPAEPISQLTAPPPIDEAERIWQITKDVACND